MIILGINAFDSLRSPALEHLEKSDLRSQWKYRFSFALLLILIACYAVQVFSPLRLNTDAVTLLSMAESARAGDGFSHRGNSVLPPGYPILLAVLLRGGMIHPWVIISLNIIFLAGGLIASYYLFIIDLSTGALLGTNLCSLSLLSFVLIKHVTLPLTDTVFLGCALCSLAITSHAFNLPLGRRFVVATTASWIIAIMSTAVRTIGIALVPTLIFALVARSDMRTWLKNRSRVTKVLLKLFIVILGAAIAWVLVTISTFQELIQFVMPSRSGPTIIRVASYRIRELGEIFVNTPVSKLPTTIQALVPFAGSLLLLLIISGLVLLNKRRPTTSTDVFLVTYMAMLCVWPFYDTRFWLPIIPLLVAYVAVAVRRHIRYGVIRTVSLAYLSLFIVFGFVGLAYSSRITFAGSRFAEVYGDGSLRVTYCVAYGTCADTAASGRVDRKALHLLRTFH